MAAMNDLHFNPNPWLQSSETLENQLLPVFFEMVAKIAETLRNHLESGSAQGILLRATPGSGLTHVTACAVHRAVKTLGRHIPVRYCSERMMPLRDLTSALSTLASTLEPAQEIVVFDTVERALPGWNGKKIATLTARLLESGRQVLLLSNSTAVLPPTPAESHLPPLNDSGAMDWMGTDRKSVV